MKQPQATRVPSRRTEAPEMQPDLTLVENKLHLPSGGVFVPDLTRCEDLDMPTRLHKGTELIGGAAVKFTIEIPEDIVDPYPALYIPGYCGPESAYKGLRNATARNGKIAITASAPRVQKRYGSLNLAHLGRPTRLLSQAAWAAMRGSMRMKDEIGIDLSQFGFDLSGHSMGGRSANSAALHHPSWVRSVTLNESPGLEPHNTPVMLKRLLFDFSRKELKESKDAELILQSLMHMVRNPVKIGLEGISVSNCNLREDVMKVRGLGKKVMIILALNDSFVSAEKCLTNSGDLPDIFARYYSWNAHHLWPQTNPFEVAMTHKQLLAEAFDSASDQPSLLAA